MEPKQTKRFEVFASPTGRTFTVQDRLTARPSGFGVFDSRDEAQAKADDANHIWDAHCDAKRASGK